MKRLLVSVILCVSAFALSACETTKTVYGQKVRRTLWVNGRVAYVLADGRTVYAPMKKDQKKADEAMVASAGEMKSVASSVTFAPTVPKTD